MNELSFQEYMISVLNVEEKCRVCLKKGQLRTIYSNYYGNVQINDMLIKLNCFVENNTSKEICGPCLQKVIRAYELTLSFDESTKYFKSLTPYFNENFNNGHNYFFDSLKKKSAHRKTITELLNQFCENSEQSKKKTKNVKDSKKDLKCFPTPVIFDTKNFGTFAINEAKTNLDQKDIDNKEIKSYSMNNIGNGCNNNLESITYPVDVACVGANMLNAEHQAENQLNYNEIPKFIVKAIPCQEGNEAKYTICINEKYSNGQNNNNEKPSCSKPTTFSSSDPELIENEKRTVVNKSNIQKPKKSDKSPNKKSTSGENKPGTSSTKSFLDLTKNEENFNVEDKNNKPKKSNKACRNSINEQNALKPETSCINSLPDLNGNADCFNLKDNTNIQTPKNSDKDPSKKTSYEENSSFNLVHSYLNSLPDLTGNEEEDKNKPKKSNKGCNSIYEENAIKAGTSCINSVPDLNGNADCFNLKDNTNIQTPKNSDKDPNKKSTYGENSTFNLVNSYLNSLPDLIGNEENCNLENEKNIQKQKISDKGSNNNSTYGENSSFNIVTSYLNNLPDLTGDSYNLEGENNIQKQISDKGSVNNNNLDSLFDLFDFDTEKLEYNANPDKNTLAIKNNSNQTEILVNKENESNSIVEPITFETERFPGFAVDQNMNDVLIGGNVCQSITNEVINLTENDENQKKNNLDDKDRSNASPVTSLSSDGHSSTSTSEPITFYAKNFPEIFGNIEKNINEDNIYIPEVEKPQKTIKRIYIPEVEKPQKTIKRIYIPEVEKPQKTIKRSNSNILDKSSTGNITTVEEPLQKKQRKRRLPARISLEIENSVRSHRKTKLPKTNAKKSKKETKRISVNGKNVIKIKPSLNPVEIIDLTGETQKSEKIPVKKEKSIKKCKVDITIEKTNEDSTLEKKSVACSNGCVKNKCKIITRSKTKNADDISKKKRTVFSITKTIDITKLKNCRLNKASNNKNLDKNIPENRECKKNATRRKSRIMEVDLKKNGTLIVSPEAVEDVLKNALNSNLITPSDFLNPIPTTFIKTKVLPCDTCNKLCLTENILRAHKCIKEE